MVQSVFDLFQHTCSQLGNQVAARHKSQGRWQDVTWSDLERDVKKVAAALIALEVGYGDRVAIISKTRLEWVVADLAILGIGACTVPVYPSSLPQDIGYILQDAGTHVVIVEDKEQLAKLTQVLSDVHVVKHIVCIDDVESSGNSKAVNWIDFLHMGEVKEFQKDVVRRGKLLRAEHLATIVYTSGTTGDPKGAMLMHSNLLYEAYAIEKLGILGANDVQLIFLPLAHIFARVLEMAWLKTGHVLVFAESIEKAVENMAETRPTLMAAVPRIYEKVQARVVSNALAAGGVKAKLAAWAFTLGEHAAKAESEGKSANSLAWKLAKRLVFSKIAKSLKERFGGELRLFISGGAPLAREITYFFKYCGVTICEGYGLTETSAATCLNLPQNVHIGTVGRPLPGTEIQIADDGEILVRGPGVFQGYWNKPKETKEALTAQGWFHTGDIGVLDREKFLRITDRKKDIIVTAGGKNIAPQKIENTLKSKSPLISQVVVHGDQRRFLSALVTLDEAALTGFAKHHKISGDYEALVKSSAIHEAVEESIRSMNAELPSYEQIKKFVILDHDLVVGEELTPTLKVKRAVCNRKYKELFDAFYE